MSGFRLPALWLRIAWPVLLFVVAGSVALAMWMQDAAERRSRTGFAALAKTNAEFVRELQLARSEQMAGYFSRMLNVQAFLRDAEGLLPEPGANLAAFRPRLNQLQEDHGVVRLDNHFEAVAAKLGNHDALVLVRPTQSRFAFLLQRETMLVLGAFWALSIGLAWTITRGVVRPLRLLADRLPHIEHDSEAELPGADREDEIGQLARAYLSTRAQLADERARREQAERLAMLGRMAAGLAHEIHNPLSAIRMHGQLIDSAPVDEVDAAVKNSMPVLLDETAKIEGLVNQWMFLARPAPPETTRTSVGKLISAAVRTQTALADHAEVELVCSVPDDLEIKADARRLSQAINNIVINAIQAMPDGGTLEISGRRDGAFAVLTFQDSGRGFSGDALQRHAELFFSEKEGGMGIGLNVSVEILKAHGGLLHVANAAGGGGIVTLQLLLA